MEEKLAKAQKLRALPEAELTQQLTLLRQELWESRLKVKAGSSQKPHRFAQLTRQIARVLTILRERYARKND